SGMNRPIARKALNAISPSPFVRLPITKSRSLTKITKRGRLEHQPRADLDLSRAVGLCRDQAEARVGHRRVRRAEGRPVEDVEDLEPKLEIRALLEREALQHRRVEVVRPVLPHIVERRRIRSDME